MRRTLILTTIGTVALTIGLGVGATMAGSSPIPPPAGMPSVTMTGKRRHMNDVDDMTSMMNGNDMTSMMAHRRHGRHAHSDARGPRRHRARRRARRLRRSTRCDDHLDGTGFGQHARPRRAPPRDPAVSHRGNHLLPCVFAAIVAVALLAAFGANPIAAGVGAAFLICPIVMGPSCGY